MTSDKGILIRNIFYMLTYAFKELNHNNFSRVATEDFEDIDDLFAEIIFRGVSSLLKHGLHREYKEVCDALPTQRGRLDVLESAKNLIQKKQLLQCEYDELSEDCDFNRIIKTTIISLIKTKNVKYERRRRLKQLLPFFVAVGQIPLKNFDWSKLRFDRNTKFYRMLIYLCFMLHERKLQTTESGNSYLETFSEPQMNRLYERFVLEYYKRHYPELSPNAGYVDWNLEEESSFDLLPQMKTDITLEGSNRTLIIDAKYYGKTLSDNYGKKLIHSANLYQIYSYVTNKDADHTGNVDGMLLYAKTQEEIVPDGAAKWKDGNRIFFKTLDLSTEFEEIKKQLDNITLLILG